eukprot:1751788-Amphidinium_carterae.1
MSPSILMDFANHSRLRYHCKFLFPNHKKICKHGKQTEATLGHLDTSDSCPPQVLMQRLGGAR